MPTPSAGIQAEVGGGCTCTPGNWIRVSSGPPVLMQAAGRDGGADVLVQGLLVQQEGQRGAPGWAQIPVWLPAVSEPPCDDS